jgi:hypothetical protein
MQYRERKKLDMTEVQSLSVSEQRLKGNFWLLSRFYAMIDCTSARIGRFRLFLLTLGLTFLESARSRNVVEMKRG